MTDLAGRFLGGVSYTEGAYVEKDYEDDNGLVTTVYLKLDNRVIKCAEPLTIDSKTQEMCEYVRKTVSNKFVTFSSDATKIIYGKKHVLLTLENDRLYVSCDETNKSRLIMFDSLTPENLEELIFNITSE